MQYLQPMPDLQSLQLYAALKIQSKGLITFLCRLNITRNIMLQERFLAASLRERERQRIRRFWYPALSTVLSDLFSQKHSKGISRLFRP